MSILRNGLRKMIDVLNRETPAPSMEAPEPVAVKPARPYSEARALATRALKENSWQPTNFSINLGVAPCNHSCIFCPQSVHKPKKARWMDMGLLEKVLNELPEEGVQIGLSSYSETIAAPNLLDAVRLMKRVRPKLRIAMASNGTLFREELFSALMDAGLDHYSYSFDAATRADYAALMQKDDFDLCWANLEKLVELRKRKGSPMQISTHIMAFEGREQDFEKFKEYWQDKVDFIQWRAVGNWGGDTWHLLDRMHDAGFTPTYHTPEKRYPCFSIFHHLKLQWDGHYYPCVAAVPDYEVEQERHCVPSLGHAREITWQQAWQNLGAMRQAHMEGRWNDYEACRSCNIWGLYDDIWTDKKEPGGTSRFHIEE